METFGSNLGYVDELYAQYLQDPASVGEAWREFFADYQPVGSPARRTVSRPFSPSIAAAPVTAPSPVSAPAAAAPPAVAPAPVVAAPPPGAQPLRGIAAKIAENMAASVDVPTATTFRQVPVKLLEENRRLVNQYQSATSGPKISFTHVIAWAIVRGIEKHPGMNAAFVDVGGVAHRQDRPEVNLGLAIDIEKRGERVLLVPNIRNAGALDFPSFVAAYDDLVYRARQGKLAVDEFAGTTASLTNPGTIGTSMSAPRLMPGQGVIVGTGAIGYPAEFTGMSPEVITELGISKVMTITSTYDHRIIQGAESGQFLATVEQLLLGGDGFYERILRELGAPYEPVAWSSDRNPRLAMGGGSSGNEEAIAKQAAVIDLVRSYRARGHLWAHIDPLGFAPDPHPELELSHHGFTLWDLDRKFIAAALAGTKGPVPLRDIVDTLRETYCRHIGVEFMHIPEPEIRKWLAERMEKSRNAEALSKELQLRIVSRLNAAEAFERFLHGTYVGHKRFSLEGAETVIPMLDELLTDAAGAGVEEAVIGMAHRGRLNVLANVLGKSYAHIFSEFEGVVDPSSSHGSGDVKYHLGATGTHTAPDGKTVRLALASNPSHLEAVDPVVEGMARARQDKLGGPGKVLPILVHGDAAFAGQGVVAETLNLSNLRGYRTGGTIHLVINNQIGFTTGPADARSSIYATDVAKMVRAPIFHVNGDHPEDAIRVMKLAFAYRQQFGRDVVIDLLCYRRWGHNEGDDPSYTSPLLYARIEQHRSVRKLYTEALMRRGVIDRLAAETFLEDFRKRMAEALDEVKRATAEAAASPVPLAPRPPEPLFLTSPEVATAVPRETLTAILEGLDRVPEGFQVHPKLAGQLARRRPAFEAGKIDWALAEALAFGSLVLEGAPVRLSGEDSGRGTFSHRHSVLFDHRSGAAHVPLQHLSPTQARFDVWDSLLSEFAVLGFDYGYSVDAPGTLVLWEAQFGDFVNGAQIIIDQFLASSEQKWGQTSSLVMLLPHGYEGQGPEHSSARLERFLQLCARENLRVINPSTPAQLFHALRRQVKAADRKPLVVLTPKSLLRHKDCVSTADDLAGRRFAEFLGDPEVDPASARRVVLSSGKVYYDLLAHRREAGIRDVALLRVEQFYPFDGERLMPMLAAHAQATDVVWAQEEPRNMGGWTFLAERLAAALAPGQALRYAGRAASGSPATGSFRRHQEEQAQILREALG